MGQLTKAQRKMIIRQPGHGPENGDTFIYKYGHSKARREKGE